MTADQHSWQQAVEWLNLNNQSQFEQNEGRSLKSTLQKSRPVSSFCKVSGKCLILSSCWYHPFNPLRWQRASVWHHFQAQRPQIYKQPSTSFRHSKDVPELSALRGEVSLSLAGKRIVILPVLPGRWGSGNCMWNNIRRFLFQSCRTKSGVGKWEKDKWRQQSKGVIFQSTEI